MTFMGSPIQVVDSMDFLLDIQDLPLDRST
jgi:hypothetical protein